MGSFTVQGDDEIFQGHIFGVVRRAIEHDGEEFTRDIVRHPGAVAVVAIDDQDRVVLVEQFRAPMKRTVLEIPAGTCDVAGEDVESTAMRELKEETGYLASEWTDLGSMMNAPGYSDQVTRLFMATGLEDVGREPSGPEELASRVVLVDLDELIDSVSAGGVFDATTSCGVLLASRRRER